MGHPFGELASRAPGHQTVELLEGFVVGLENRLVEVAAESVLGGHPARYLPIVFCGHTGLGKSHIALGLAAAWRASFPGRPAVCTTAVDFARQLADAIETKTLDGFGTRYRKAALLVMEDLDHLSEKPAAQEELAYTLDALADSRSFAVLTARAAPGQLASLLPRLRSRLAAGLTVPLAPPGPAARRVIVQRLAEAQGVALPESAAQALADEMAATVPALRGALLQFKLKAELDGRPLELATVVDYLSERARRKVPTIEQIAKATARHFSLKRSDLRSSSRARSVVAARGVAMHLARMLTTDSLEQIGRYFGGRDHTTVSHNCRKMEELLEREPIVRQAVFQLHQKLQTPEA